MKARVIATGEIVEVENCSADMCVEKFGEVSGGLFHITELDFDNLESPDYWTRLEHQYAGEFMRSFLDNFDGTASMAQLTDDAIDLARAFVQKLKEKEEEK